MGLPVFGMNNGGTQQHFNENYDGYGPISALQVIVLGMETSSVLKRIVVGLGLAVFYNELWWIC